MRYCLLLIALCMHLNIVKAQGVVFCDISLEQAFARASASGKKYIFIDCYTSWCGPCKYMAEHVFTRQECGNYLNSTFITLKYDMEKAYGKEIRKKYNVESYPTFLILDTQGNEINRIVGRSNAAVFVDKVKKALNPESNIELLYAAYAKTGDIDKYCKYLDLLKERGERDKMVESITATFESLRYKDKFNINFWEILTNDTRLFMEIDSAVFNFYLHHKLDGDRLLGEKRIDREIIKSYKYCLFFYLAGIKYQHISQESIKTISERLNYLAPGDGGANLLSDMALARYEGNNSFIIDVLENGRLGALTKDDADLVETCIIEYPGFNREEKVLVKRYLEALVNANEAMLNYTKKLFTDYN